MSTVNMIGPARMNDDVTVRGGASLQWIAFVPHGDDPRPVVTKVSGTCIHAVVAGSAAGMAAEVLEAVVDGPRADLGLLVLPGSPDHDGTLPAEAIAWVEEGGPTQMLALHGAVVAWAPGRAVIIAASDRLAAVRAAVVEFCFFERELRSIEAEVTAAWPHVDADAPLAFEFNDRDAGRRREIGERFRRTVALRGRLARLAPHLERPPLFPPTLASQVAERLRERSRMAERAGFLDGQITVQERVYDLCGERSSDWTIARRSIALEWAIVVLLVVQTALLVAELLTTSGG